MGLEQNNEQHYRQVVDKFHDPAASYTMTVRDYVLRITADTEAVTITLPPVAEAKGRFYSIKCRDASFAVTIQDQDDSEDWQGDIVMAIAGCHELFYSDGLKWMNILFPFDKTITGEGWSLNRLAVVSTATVGEGTRGFRINMTTSPGIVSGDLQCFHGFLTLGLAASLAAGAAISPLSGWLEIPDTTTTSTGNVLCAVRGIVDPGNNALHSLTGGGESSIFYGQTWASTGSIDSGLRIAIGAGSTITSVITIGGAGTIGRIFDFTQTGGAGGGGELEVALWDAQDAQTRHIRWFMGDLATRATIRAQVGDLVGMGSLYFSTNGEAFIKVAGAGADTDWEVINHAAADAG
jgi:hypothetical protein